MQNIKNYLIKTLTKIVPLTYRNPFESHEKMRVLIVSTTGLGDTLWATPAIKAIKTTYPNSFLGVLTSPIGKEILQHNPYVDEVYEIKRSFISILRLLPLLKSKKFEIGLIFHFSQRPVLPLMHFAGCSKILGIQGENKGLDELLTDRIYKKEEHEIEKRLRLASLIGAKAKDLSMDFLIPDEDSEQMDEWLQRDGKETLIGLHPGSKDLFKRWEPDYFIKLGQRLQNELNAKIVLTGSKEEKSLADKICAHIPKSISLAGKLSLSKLAALLKKLSFFISNDTGPMHLSFALNTPTLALFTPTDPLICGPYPFSSSVIARKKTCTPCLKKKCLDPFCLRQISPDEVYEAVYERLK